MGKVTDTYMPKKHWQFVIEAIDDEVKKQCEQLKKKKEIEMEEVLRRALNAAYQTSLEMTIEDGIKEDQQGKFSDAALKEFTGKLQDVIKKTLEKEKTEQAPEEKDLKAWLKVWESVKQNPPPSKPLFDRWRLDFCLAISRESGPKDQYALFLGQFEGAYTFSVEKWESNKKATFQMKKDYQSVLKWTAVWMTLALTAYLMCSISLPLIAILLHFILRSIPDARLQEMLPIGIVAGFIAACFVAIGCFVKRQSVKKECKDSEKKCPLRVMPTFAIILAIVLVLHLTIEALTDIQLEIPSIPFAVILVVEGLILLIGLILAGVKSLEYDTKNPQETWARHEETVQKMNLEMLRYLLLKDRYRRPKPENSSEHPVVSTSIQVFPCPPKAEEKAQSVEMEFMEAIIQILEEDNAKFVRNMEDKERSMTKILGIFKIPNIPS